MTSATHWELSRGELTFTVKESPRRTTVSLGVERDGQLVILAPVGISPSRLEALVQAKQDWLYGKLALKQHHRERPRREFVTGEGFWYAGRSYRLQLVSRTAQGAELSLHQGRFELTRDRVPSGRAAFIAWYKAHLRAWAQGTLARHASRLHCLPRALRVLDLGQRWGSCNSSQELYLHWRVALLPRRMAEYVLLHELVHLEYHHHRAEFWSRLEVLLPDYAERKAWLALNGAEYDL
ncbi:M48 family peptidase [Deinococcus psychrotolerans]|uniref:M48 family peptidase n=1 Tax=Deinococcus psychrotolerans TaxID=2489213 RepID=A0A3G8YE17_9DEIO|nr:SprT family zinc-dependent metalloprotease [Deinococcus psychrotolerans]AZI43215.1 M48 family peptidase [Deinococcus psychrotolerans]